MRVGRIYIFQSRNKIRSAAEAFFGCHKSRFPITARPFLVSHIHNRDRCCCVRRGLPATILNIVFMPVQCYVNRVAINDCNTKFSLRIRSGADPKFGGVWVKVRSCWLIRMVTVNMRKKSSFRFSSNIRRLRFSLRHINGLTMAVLTPIGIHDSP